jgi:hypothetical protein
MPRPENILSTCEHKDKDGLLGPVQCPACGSRAGHTKHGFYARYAVDGEHLVLVPRYRCHNRACPKVTFSILPFPFLPWIRHRLCFLLWLVQTVMEGKSLRATSVTQHRTRGVIRRAIKRGRQVLAWFSKERHRSRWGPNPWRSPTAHWTAFTQGFSCAVFPTIFPR